MTKDRVAIVKAKDYSQLNMALQKGFSLIKTPFKKDTNVVIKPNLCSEKSFQSGATVNKETIEAVIKIINERTENGCKISVVESDARGIDADVAFEIFDLLSLSDEYDNVKTVNLSKDATTSIYLEDSPALSTLEVPETLMSCDYFISIAKLKTSSTERMTGILKNQFGCITKKYKSIFHPFMGEVLWELNNLYHPELCIVDGIVGMEGFGPTDGSPKNSGILIIGNNSIATDCVAAQCMMIEPKSVPHLRYVMKRNGYKSDDYKVLGESISSVASEFKFIPEGAYLLTRMGLSCQRLGTYINNSSELMMKVGSAMASMGTREVADKVSYKQILKTMYDMVFKFTK